MQRIKPEPKTASGIILPENSVKDIPQAKVLAVGPGALDRNGNKIPVNVIPGDRVLIPEVSRHESRQHNTEAMDSNRADHSCLCSLVEVA